MQLRDVMTRRVESVRPDATLEDAARRMEELDVGVLPVCEGGRVIGMVTDRDIVIRAVASGREPTRTKVCEILSTGVVVAHEDQDVEEAARLMQRHQIRRVPVVRDGRKLVGIVSLGDLAVKTDDERHVGQALEGISQPSSEARELGGSGSGGTVSRRETKMHNRYWNMSNEREGFGRQQGRDEQGSERDNRQDQDRFDQGRYEQGREGRFGSEGRMDQGNRGMNQSYGQEGRMDQGNRGWNEPFGREGRMDQGNRGWNQPQEYEDRSRSRGSAGEFDRSYGQDRSYGNQGYGHSYGQQSHQGFGQGGQSYQGGGNQQGMSGGYGQTGQTHKGRGPKGYKRSDERIREEVCDRLTEHGDIDASDIEVKVQNGEVTLTGTVPEKRFKHLAEQIVESLSGVQEVNNQLRTKREDTSSFTSKQAPGNGVTSETQKPSQEARRST
jgi:CBS domain-containing protein/osmotically-inducible protein OsmY